MDTSSTTQVVQILEQYRRPSGFSWEILVRTPTCRTLMVGTARRSSVGTCMGESTEFGMLVLFIGNKDCSCRYTWTTSTWLERSRIWSPYGRNWWNWSILENQRHFLTTCIWDVLAERNLLLMNTEKMFESWNFCWSNWKMPGRETLHEKTVAWSYDMEGHAKVRWKILWPGEYIYRAVVQSLNSLLGWSVYVDDIKMAGKKQNMGPMWKKLVKLGRSWRTNIILWPRIFRMHSTWM